MKSYFDSNPITRFKVDDSVKHIFPNLQEVLNRYGVKQPTPEEIKKRQLAKLNRI